MMLQDCTPKSVPIVRRRRLNPSAGAMDAEDRMLIQLPKGVTPVHSKGRTYYYHQDRRGKPDAGPRTALGQYGTRDFWARLARVTGQVEMAMAFKPRLNTYKGLIADYKANSPKWPSYRKSTRAMYETAFAHIVRFIGGQNPAHTTAANILELQATFVDAPGAGNIVLSLMRSLLRWAIIKGLRADNPARDVELLEMEPDGAKPFTPAAWEAISNSAAPEALRRYAVLARATGQRISDVLTMNPAQRDEEGLLITITKLRDREHWCPLRPQELAELDGWNIRDCGLYITDEDGEPHTDGSFRSVWRRYQQTAEGKALQGFTSHDLRATKVCDERIRGKPHQQIAAMVGMSLPMVMKYSKHIDQRLAARGVALGQEGGR